MRIRCNRGTEDDVDTSRSLFWVLRCRDQAPEDRLQVVAQCELVGDTQDSEFTIFKPNIWILVEEKVLITTWKKKQAEGVREVY